MISIPGEPTSYPGSPLKCGSSRNRAQQQQQEAQWQQQQQQQEQLFSAAANVAPAGCCKLPAAAGRQEMSSKRSSDVAPYVYLESEAAEQLAGAAVHSILHSKRSNRLQQKQTGSSWWSAISISCKLQFKGCNGSLW